MYDPLAADVIADPYPFYHRLREHDPVYWHGQLDSWVLTGYEECRQVLGDTGHFGSDFRRCGVDIPAAQLSIQSLDPPEHGAIRHLLVSALHAQPAQAAERRLTATAEALLAALPRDGAVDLIPGLARPVALRTVAEFLGVAPPAGPAFEEMSNAIVRSMDAGLEPERAGPGNQARGALAHLLTQWLAEPAADGYLAAVLRARQSADDVPPEVLANSLRAVLHAGYESVSRLLGNVLARIATSEDTAGMIGAAGGDLAPLADELIRLDGPVQADARVCVRDRELGGHTVRRGEVLVLMLAAANRDPKVFVDPDVVDVTRRRGVHLAFGRGAHACLGAALGTQQLIAVLKALHATGTWFRCAEAPRYERTATLRGLAALPVHVI
ncbi:cytochrome P450 [Micromonospora rubida]